MSIFVDDIFHWTNCIVGLDTKYPSSGLWEKGRDSLNQTADRTKARAKLHMLNWNITWGLLHHVGHWLTKNQHSSATWKVGKAGFYLMIYGWPQWCSAITQSQEVWHRSASFSIQVLTGFVQEDPLHNMVPTDLCNSIIPHKPVACHTVVHQLLSVSYLKRSVPTKMHQISSFSGTEWTTGTVVPTRALKLCRSVVALLQVYHLHCKSATWIREQRKIPRPLAPIAPA